MNNNLLNNNNLWIMAELPPSANGQVVPISDVADEKTALVEIQKVWNKNHPDRPVNWKRTAHTTYSGRIYKDDGGGFWRLYSPKEFLDFCTSVTTYLQSN